MNDPRAHALIFREFPADRNISSLYVLSSLHLFKIRRFFAAMLVVKDVILEDPSGDS